MITPERRTKLKSIYRRAVLNTDQAKTQLRWFEYLAALWLEGGDLEIFFELRELPRQNAANLDRQFMSGEITERQIFNQIRRQCADLYATRLNKFGIAEIDITSSIYLQISREMAIQVIRAWQDIDPTDKTKVCIAMAKLWHNFVKLLHAQYGLPTVKEMRVRLTARSDAEEFVLDSEDFETRMTVRERARIEAVIR